MTEKLWDCLEAGAVPLYLGAPNILDHLPFGRRSAIFIDDFKDIDELAAHLNKVWAPHLAGTHGSSLRAPPCAKFSHLVVSLGGHHSLRRLLLTKLFGNPIDRGSLKSRHRSADPLTVTW